MGAGSNREPASAVGPAARLGEELPVFCERCGYSLHGLPQGRCAECSILQFHCPECGHHQPINTLRPAFQSMLGRLRAVMLVGSVILKLAFFSFSLLGFFGASTRIPYQYNPNAYQSGGGGSGQNFTQVAPREVPSRIEDGEYIALAITGFLFGAVARMLVLRWRRALFVAPCVAGLIVLALTAGAAASWRGSFDDPFPYASPFTAAYLRAIGCAAFAVCIGVLVVWPIWCAVVKALLPERAGRALLAWQRSMSDRTGGATHVASVLSREPTEPSRPYHLDRTAVRN